MPCHAMYAFHNRALHRKRKELSSLREEVESLHSQLKAKRRNLVTLEKLVKESSKSAQKGGILAKDEETTPPETIKFYLSLPNNLFMELEERPSTTIRNIISQAKNVLLTDPTFDDSMLVAEDDKSHLGLLLKLFSKGKLLLPDSTLEHCGILPGDTLVASLPGSTKPANRQKQPSAVSFPAPEQVKFIPAPEPKTENNETKLMMEGLRELLQKQVKTMEQFAAEVSNCTNALSAAKTVEPVPAIDEGKLLGQMDDRLRNIGMEIKDNLAKIQILEEQRRGLVFGELENDTEDLTGAIKEINQQLRQSSSKMDSITGEVKDTSSAIGRVSETLKTQQEQLNELRMSLQKIPTTSTPVVITAPPLAAPVAAAPPPQPVVVTIPKDNVSLKSNKWNTLIASQPEVLPVKPISQPMAAAEAEVPQVIDTVHSIEFTPTVQKKEPEVVIRPEPKAEPKPEPKAVPKAEPKPTMPPPKPEVKPVIQKTESKVSTPTPVSVVFDMEQNADLQSVNVVKVVVPLERELPPDEIIFTIRKTTASKVALPFSAISLLWDKKVIKLGLDVPKSVPFSAVDVQKYATSGRLTLRLQKPKTLSDAQIDSLLVPAWQNSHVKAKTTSKVGKFQDNLLEEKDDADDKAWEEMEPDRVSVKETLDSYESLRLSLDGMLRELNDKGGLTDEEMTKKRADLEAYSSASPSESEQWHKYRGSIAGALGAAAASDSGTENARRHSNYLRSVSPFQKSVTFSPHASVNLRSSADLGPLLRLRSSARKNEQEDDEDNAVRESRSGVRRSWQDTTDDNDRSYGAYDDDLPMLSSLSQPLRPAVSSATISNPAGSIIIAKTANNDSAKNLVSGSGSLSVGSHQGKRRYGAESGVDDATPSYVSSLADDTLHTSYSRPVDRSSSKAADDQSSIFSPFKSNETKSDVKDVHEDSSISYQDSLSQGLSTTNFSTLTSALPDGVTLSQTIDSEGDMLIRGDSAGVDQRMVRRQAELYERQAAKQVEELDVEGEEEGASITSPFKDFSRGRSMSQTNLEVADTSSVNSLALSDSHNMD
eukprot:scaffold1884_cov343-Ochromonas_danica.AAC.67